MEYRIIAGWTATSVEAEVRGLIAAGWRPCGGLTLTIDPETRLIYCAQAMVKDA